MVEQVLEVRSASVSFGGLIAVDDISFSVTRGQVLGVIGPNGAGKTTLLNALSGVIPLHRGDVRLNGVQLSGLKPHRIAALGVGRTFQGADYFLESTVLDVLMLGQWTHSRRSIAGAMFRVPSTVKSERRQRDRAMSALEDLGLAAIAEVPMATLSYGTRKILDVLRAVLLEPTVLLLDEPTSGTTSIDRKVLYDLVANLKTRDIAIIVVDHDVRFISELSDVMLAMNFGRLLGIGRPRELLARDDVRAAYVGLE